MPELNPDALRDAGRALYEHVKSQQMDGHPWEEWEDLGEGQDIVIGEAECAVEAYLAVAQPLVNSVEELDALPDGAYVQGYDGYKHAKNDEGTWNIVVNHRATPHGSDSIELPALVLYRPEVNDA